MINLINKLLFLLNLPLITYYSPYSREERNRIYKKAIEYAHLVDTIPYLCSVILLASMKETNNRNFRFEGILSNFPELNIYKPILLRNKYGYYWKRGLKEPRIKALEKAIKLTE